MSQSTPSTPERPSLAGVLIEKLYKPTDLLKSKLREEFLEREKKMLHLDRFINQTMAELGSQDNELDVQRQSKTNEDDKIRNEKNCGRYFL